MMKTRSILALTLAVLLLCGLCACAAKKSSAETSGKDTAAAPAESPAETQRDTAPAETQTDLEPTEPEPTEPEPTEPETEPEPTEPETKRETEPEPTEPETEPQPQTEPETKTVSLTLPYMETEDYFSFRPEDGEGSAGLTLQIPGDWTEDSGLFYCPYEDGVRKVLEPVCLLRDMDDEKWEALAQFDIAGNYGELEFLSVDPGVDANGRDYIRQLGKCWPDGGGTIRVWYPCICFLRDTNGTAAVLTCYLLDPEDPSAQAELEAILDSIRLE